VEQIVLATGNKGKIREFSEAFSHLSIDCVPVKDVISIEEPEEIGTTFMENALLKAHYYAKATNRPCLADDSGITVDALNGAPGVYSARYAGHHGDDQANNEKLIRELPKGDNGFGYDPYFYVPEFEKTMAELSIEEKETISHRGRALRKLINKL